MVGTERVGLPSKPFFYTPDQIAMLLEVKESYLRQSLIHYDRRSVGPCPRDKIKAIDISPDDADKPEWRISEQAFVRWLRFKGLKFHSRGYIS